MQRKKAYYVIETVQSLMTNITTSQMNDILIIILITEYDNKEYVHQITSDVERYFPEAVDEGSLQVIVSNPAFYPSLDSLPRLYGDKPERVKWRSKQALDYAFLYYYAVHLGEYFVQLEDDIIAVDNYLHKMKMHIDIYKDDQWSVLEFGARGFIGMTYRNSDLPALAKFVRFYYWTMPVDWLFRAFNDIFLHGNSKEFKIIPPLFKHVGMVSSLHGQTRRLEDLQNKDDEMRDDVSLNVKNVFRTSKRNPEATIRTSIVDYVNPHSIENPYKKRGFFWGKSLSNGDFIEITFVEPQAVKRIIVQSGSRTHPNDKLSKTGLQFASLMGHGIKCSANYTTITVFNDAVIDYKFVGPTKQLQPIKCLRLVLMEVSRTENGAPNWLVISNMEIVV